jgi:hypothetical protein
MGLPDFLFDSHKRYKADTDRVAAWLAETAQKFGHALKSQPSMSRPAGSARLKGKARKEAREKAATTSPTTTAVAVPYTITTQEFTSLAELIANRSPPIKVPQFILTLLRSAIALRKRCSDWFQSKATHEGAKNLTHSHFITVLERVLQILEPHSPSKTITTSIEADSQVENMTNIFDVLNIEEDELNESVVTTPTTQIVGLPQDVASDIPPRRYEVEADKEEVYFALYCFFDDLDRLRKFIYDLWSDYRVGKTDLITASVTTNMAINLVHRAEQEFITIFPKLDSYDKMSGVFYWIMCHIRGEDPADREFPDDLVNPAMVDVADWLYMPVNVLLNSFCQVIQANHVPVLKLGHLGIYDPHADRSKLTVRQLMQEDRIILMEALPEFFAVSKIKSCLPVPDELTNGLLSMFAAKTIPLWVTYASQIFLGIHHTLRTDVVRGLSELRASGIRANESLKKYFDADKRCTSDGWSSSNEETVKEISRLIDQWIIGDAFAQVKTILLRSSSTVEPYSLFRRHPLLCGLLQFRMYTLLQEAGITLANAWGSILYVAHLYNACRQGAYLKDIWPDLELVMDIHTRERMFSGRIPTTPEEYLKSLALMLGASPQSFARSSRVSQLKFSKKGPKRMIPNSWVADVFHNQYFETGNATLTLDTIQRLLHDQKIVASTSLIAWESKDQSLLQLQWAKSHKMTPLQLLDTLRRAIIIEEPMLRLDYFSLHLRCLELLRSLRTVLDDKLRQYFGNNYIENETQLPFIVGYIFQVASGSSRAFEATEIRNGVESLILRRTGEFLKEYIEREGRVECDKLKKHVCIT